MNEDIEIVHASALVLEKINIESTQPTRNDSPKAMSTNGINCLIYITDYMLMMLVTVKNEVIVFLS